MGISMLIFAGCGDAPKPSLSGNGVEDIQVEEIRVEEIRVEEIRIESLEQGYCPILFSRTEILSYNKEVIIMKFNQMLFGMVPALITKFIFGIDVATLMLASIMVGCIIYNLYTIMRRKSV